MTGAPSHWRRNGARYICDKLFCAALEQRLGWVVNESFDGLFENVEDLVDDLIDAELCAKIEAASATSSHLQMSSQNQKPQTGDAGKSPQREHLADLEDLTLALAGADVDLSQTFGGVRLNSSGRSGGHPVGAVQDPLQGEFAGRKGTRMNGIYNKGNLHAYLSQPPRPLDERLTTSLASALKNRWAGNWSDLADEFQLEVTRVQTGAAGPDRVILSSDQLTAEQVDEVVRAGEQNWLWYQFDGKTHALPGPFEDFVTEIEAIEVPHFAELRRGEVKKMLATQLNVSTKTVYNRADRLFGGIEQMQEYWRSYHAADEERE